MHDAESASSVMPLRQTSATALVTDGNGHREASHVQMPKFPASKLLLRCWPHILCRKPPCTTLSQQSRSLHCRKHQQLRWLPKATDTGNDHTCKMPRFQVSELLSRCWLYIPCAKPLCTTLSQQSWSPCCRKLPQLRWLQKATNTGRDRR